MEAGMQERQFTIAFLLGAGLLLGVTDVAAAAQGVAAVEEAKAVVKSHEEFVLSGNLDGVMSNCTDDVVVLAAGAPLQVGKAAVRSMYASILQAKPPRGEHQYQGGVAIGELVILHGVFKIAATPDTPAMANNFILTLRREADGKYRFWRVAFAPAGS
jgi:ketosteroid isomerase-like protein